MSRARRRQNLRTTAVVFMIVVIVIIGFIVVGNQMRQPQQQIMRYTYPLPPSNQPPTEQKQQGGIIESLSNLFKPIAESLGLSTTPMPGSETVGLDAEFGITSSSGESLIFTKNVLSGVYVGEVGFAGVYIKPGFGSKPALKLYDESRPEYEGEIWVSPILKVRVFNGTPKGYTFKTTVKVSVDGQIVDSKTLERSGVGAPAMEIRMDKVSIKGRDIHQILKTPKGKPISIGKGILKEASLLQTPVVEGRQVCFYVDYEGLVIFEDPVTHEESPVYRKLNNANLGCFDFAIAETGDFEMKVDKNVTVAPIAEVLTSGQVGVQGIETKTVTHTITVPVGTYTTTVGGQVQTVTSYRTMTITNTVTQYVPITTTITEIRKEPITVTTTVTVYVSGGGGGSALYNSSVITIEDGRERTKTLAEVKAGDYVLTDRGFRKVTNVKEILVDNLYSIYIEGGYILRADSLQPILTAKGVKRVGELMEGDLVYTLDGWRRVERIERTIYGKPTVRVIDIAFDEFAFYYTDGVLVEDAYLKSGVILLTYPYSEFIFIGR
ncbi:MAG: hypothetical protein LZ173_03595, partial [Thaumarchaeota archaeon]|nr:hypothetical protein [Candidatus Geocrenenecus arthurdayi]